MNDMDGNFFKGSVTDVSEYNYVFIDGNEKINTNNFPNEFFEIVELFEKEGSKKHFSVMFKGNILNIYGTNDFGQVNELELKLRKNALEVKSVEFIEKNKGKWTKLYRILKEIQKKYDLNKIIIEACVSDILEEWCGKHGFVEMKDRTDSFIEE